MAKTGVNGTAKAERLDELKYDHSQAKLSDGDVLLLRECTTKIRRIIKLTAAQVVELGHLMANARGLLPSGEFGKWLKAEFDLDDYRLAEHWIHVSVEFGGRDLTRSKTAKSVLYKLSAPSVPLSVKEEARERIDRGEKITHKGADKIIEKHQGRPAPVVENFTTPPVEAPAPPGEAPPVEAPAPKPEDLSPEGMEVEHKAAAEKGKQRKPAKEKEPTPHSAADARQFVLFFGAPEFKEFSELLGKLAPVYSTTNPTATVLYSLRALWMILEDERTKKEETKKEENEGGKP
jgi:hypothetical protein